MEIEIVKRDNGCHDCVSHTPNSNGYPVIHWNGKCSHMSRWLYEMVFGELEEGLIVRHTCDNPLCLNIDHFVVGTTDDNVADRVSRDRSAKGAENGRAKLDEDKVKEILKSVEDSRELATKYNVHITTIQLIRRRKIWKHVEV